MIYGNSMFDEIRATQTENLRISPNYSVFEDAIMKTIICNSLLNLNKKHTALTSASPEKLFETSLSKLHALDFFLKEIGSLDRYHDDPSNSQIPTFIAKDTNLIFTALRGNHHKQYEKLSLLEIFKWSDEVISDFAHLRMNLRYLNGLLKNRITHDKVCDFIESSISSNDVNLKSLKSLLNNDNFKTPELAKSVSLNFKSRDNSISPLESETIIKAVEDGRVWVRTIINPHLTSAESERRNSRLYQQKITPAERACFFRGSRDYYGELEARRLKRHETGAQLEFRKVMREAGIPTLASAEKINRLNKHGNINKPVSKLDYGSPPFDEIGYGIIKNYSNKHDFLNDITKVSNFSLNTGFGKDHKHIPKASDQSIIESLVKLDRHLKMGEFSDTRKAVPKKFNESIMNIHKEDVKLIFYYLGETYKKSTQNVYQKQLLAIYASKVFRLEALKAYTGMISGMISDKNNLLLDYQKMSSKDLPIYEFRQDALYPVMKNYSSNDIIELAARDFSDFTKEHFEVLEQLSPLDNNECRSKFFSKNIVDKYMDNEYIKILHPNLRKNIKTIITDISVQLGEMFLIKNLENPNLFRILDGLNKLSADTITCPGIKAFIHTKSDNITLKLTNKHFVNNLELEALTNLINTKNNDAYFDKTNLTVLRKHLKNYFPRNKGFFNFY